MSGDSQRPSARDQARRTSGVLDAILDKVDESEGAEVDPRGTLFRAEALERLDVPLEVDTLLPLTSRRSWLLLVGAFALILAVVGYAAATTVTESVQTIGRAVGADGVATVAAPTAGIVAGWSVDVGDEVSSGDEVVVIDEAAGSIGVPTASAGTLWQQLVALGDAVAPGSSVATVIGADSERTALVAVTEREAADIRPGDPVRLGDVTGTVRSVALGPLPADTAAQRLGLGPSGTTEAISGPVVLVTVDLDVDVPAGSLLAGDIVTERSTLLEWIF